MRIGMDVRYLSHGLVGGVHTYVANLVPALAAAAPEYQFFLYADNKRSFELTALPANATLRTLPYRNPLSSAVLDLTIKRAMAEDALDVVHFPANYGFAPADVAAVITLHDAINILPLREIIRGHRKNVRTIAMMTYLHWMTTAAVRRADRLITVSNFSRDQIAKVGIFPASQIVPVTHPPAPHIQRVDDPEELARLRAAYDLTQPFLLADALKNPETLLAAWALLPENLRQEHRIVFFCRHANPPACVADAVAQGFARLLIRPSFHDLCGLYSLAAAFVFPSLIEGLGLPPLEAMICGTPVIASNRGSIPEVVGDAALLADADDAIAFALHIRNVLTVPELRESLVERGYLRARCFTWTNTAERVLEVYRNAAEMHSAEPPVVAW